MFFMDLSIGTLSKQVDCKVPIKNNEQKISQLSVLRDEMKKMLAACESGKSHNCQPMNTLSNHQLCDHEHG